MCGESKALMSIVEKCISEWGDNAMTITTQQRRAHKLLQLATRKGRSDKERARKPEFKVHWALANDVVAHILHPVSFTVSEQYIEYGNE